VTSWAGPFRGKWWLRGCLCGCAITVTTDSKVEFQCPKLEVWYRGLRGGMALVAIQGNYPILMLVKPLGGELMGQLMP
jgi:hypothetical protein